MERSMGSKVCRNILFSWTHRRHYQRLSTPKPRRPAARGIRLGRRRVLGSASWKYEQLRAKVRSPLHLLGRIVEAYINSILAQSLKIVRGVPDVMPCECKGAPLKVPRVAASKYGEVDKRKMMLNFYVAEVLLRRSSSEVKRSPLHQGKVARSASVRA